MYRQNIIKQYNNYRNKYLALLGKSVLDNYFAANYFFKQHHGSFLPEQIVAAITRKYILKFGEPQPSHLCLCIWHQKVN